MKECPKCHTMIEDDAVFCGVCGTKQENEEVEAQAEEQSSQEEQFCVHCGKSIEVGSLFCPYCGKPQDVEETKSEEPQPKAEEPKREETQTEEPQVKEEQNVKESSKKESPKEETQAEEEPEYELEENKKSKTWIWILIMFLLLGGGILFLLNYSAFSKNNQEQVEVDTVSVINEIEKEKVEVEEEIANAEDFLKKMYEEFYESSNTDRFDKEVLSKYFTEGVMSKFYVESDYSALDFFYSTDFLIDGCVSGGALPDYGNKVVTRTIEDKGDGWYEVTNIWDVIKRPVKVRLKVDKIGSKFFISDFLIIDNEHDSTEVKEEVSDEAAMTENRENEMKANDLVKDNE